MYILWLLIKTPIMLGHAPQIRVRIPGEADDLAKKTAVLAE